MSLNKASFWLTTVVVLAGCPGPEKKPQLGAVMVSCAPTSLEVGQTSQCTASATYEGDQPATPSSYVWTSSNESVATVDSTGKVTPKGGGTVTLGASATVDGVTKEGQATLTIIQPTLHETAITGNETWRAANNPHVVRGALQVTGATLTIEAGVELRFDQDSELRVTTGALRALGTPETPIRMVARQSVPTKGYWRGVVLAASGSDSELNYVTLSHCGNASGKGACLALENQAAPVLRHVTVRDSGTAGVLVADDGSAFGTESTALNVSGSEGYAVRIGANQASTLPAESTFTGNTLQAIELRGDVLRTQTWPNPGLPYVVTDRVKVGSSTTPTLTIPAGTVLRFGAGARLTVGNGGSTGTLPGELIVDGTATAPVLLTADAASPTPGHWWGVHMFPRSSSNTRLSHAIIEYGGGGDTDRANLEVFGQGARPVINDVIVRKSLTYGAKLSSGGEFGPGSTRLSAHDNGSYAVFTEADEAGTLPTGGTFHGNGRDAVNIGYGGVGTTQRWPNLGIPYVISDFINVGSASTTPTLTLSPGTELRFRPEAGISVGADGRPGILWADGLVDVDNPRPIRFVPDTSTPTRGFWRGLHFWDATGSLLNLIVVTHAGAGGPAPSIGTGNLNMYKDSGDNIVNSTFSDSAGCGITVSDGTRPGTTNVPYDFVVSNYFSNNTGANQCKN
ncbi:Ig-like protein group 2 [Archangium gephyra]|uniref:Ig-like domain protein n=1 Tax=Archangium gephyra TaxID=48 RepID=A0AAC8QAX6_9BACT|nr:Ig-like domain-containing protein [Archangium gephyra]AKJ04106.1 Putative Ig-like domain protein [Archangium gephyra]REG37813.1 Ig-like protein group 2 [Archangium gephyra]